MPAVRHSAWQMGPQSVILTRVPKVSVAAATLLVGSSGYWEGRCRQGTHWAPLYMPGEAPSPQEVAHFAPVWSATRRQLSWRLPLPPLPPFAPVEESLVITGEKPHLCFRAPNRIRTLVPGTHQNNPQFTQMFRTARTYKVSLLIP